MAALATFVRVALAAATPVVVDFSSGNAYDDELFVRLGLSIASGDWLGTFGEITMAKNPGYPMFLAFCGVTHIPYQVALITLIAIGAAVCALAVKPIVKSPVVILAIYLVILFNPLSFTTAFFRRIYRDALVIPFAMTALASYIGLYLRRDRGIRACAPWAILAGLSTACLQVIKENGLWIIPFACVCSAVIIGSWLLSARREQIQVRDALVRCMVLILLPALLTPLFKGAVKAKNQSVYGVSAMSDRFDGAFSKACSKLSLIDGGANSSSIWVSRQAMSEALVASPTLATIEDDIWASWTQWSALFDGNEIYGDMCYWALMDAGNAAGKYDSATTASEFWNSVASELDDALTSGRLASRSGLRISSVAPPIDESNLLAWISRTLKTSVRLSTLDIMDCRMISDWQGSAQDSDSLDEDGQAVAAMLGDNVIFTKGTEQTVPQGTLANKIDSALGHLMVMVARALFVLMLPCLAYALLSGVLAQRKGARLEAGLIVAGLLLTALAFEAATTWYVMYQLTIFDYTSYITEAYKYSPEFVVALLMAALYAVSFVLGSLDIRSLFGRCEKPTAD